MAVAETLIAVEVFKVLLGVCASYAKQNQLDEEQINKAYREVMDEVRLLDPNDLPK